MRAQTAKHCVVAAVVTTTALTFIQPTVIHQLVIWVAGMFTVLVCLALVVISATEQKQPAKASPDFMTEAQVIVMRQHKCSDEYIAKTLGISVETVKGMGV